MANAKQYTVNDLITSVTRRGTIPVSETTISNDDIIRFANEEMDENLVALILSVREEIYLTYEDITLVQGQSEYPIPYRAIGSKIRIIKPLGANNQELYPLVPVDLEKTLDYTNNTFSGGSTGFYLRNDKFVLTPNVNGLGTETIRVYYYLRPNSLVPLNKGAKIKSISGNSVVVDNIPSGMNNTSQVDIIQSLPNHKTYDWDLNITVNTATKTITFTNLPSEVKVGDYICLAGETVVPQIPVDIIPLLEQSVVCKVLEAIGDTEGLRNAYARLEKLEKRLLNIIDQRIEAPGRKIVQASGFLNNRRSNRRGWF
jgi:hypothetical protein